MLASSRSCGTLGRNLVNGQVDVLGTQLEEVIEYPKSR